MLTDDDRALGVRLLAQADALAAFTEEAPALTRTYLGPQHRAAGDYLAALMREAGMDASYDALGNLVGRYPGAQADAPVLMIGSHMDSVRNAGRYDGLFGILSAIAIPNYGNYVLRTRLTDAYSGLAGVQPALEQQSVGRVISGGVRVQPGHEDDAGHPTVEQ